MISHTGLMSPRHSKVVYKKFCLSCLDLVQISVSTTTSNKTFSFKFVILEKAPL